MTEPSTLPRRGLNTRQIETVERLYAAATELLDEVGYDDLTVRLVAARAGVSPATAYTYLASKDHLCAALYWRRLVALPPVPEEAGTPVERLQRAVREVAGMLADAPALATAATRSLLGPEPEVAQLRAAIGAHWAERFRTAVGAELPDDVVMTVVAMFTGTLLQAGMGVIDYPALGDHLATSVEVILRGW